MNILTIVGARPQFIKASVVSRRLQAWGIQEAILHTGQHYDDEMSRVFFEELGIPEPFCNLGIAGGSHGEMTGRMLPAIEAELLARRPDWVLVYGDTNSTLAGALAASKIPLPIAHVEAGLRSFNRRMPEEINRILTDHLSSLLFCPTFASVQNLTREGITEGVFHTGDVMAEAALLFGEIAERTSTILRRYALSPQSFFLVTIHRAENTDDPQRLGGIVTALHQLAQERPVVLPLHPRTRQSLARMEEENPRITEFLSKLHILPPVSFLDMVMLEKNALLILTDSGGVQKEAVFHRVPCVTLREETEWVETVEAGWNRLAGADPDRILEAVRWASPGRPIAEYGTEASKEIASLLASYRPPRPPED